MPKKVDERQIRTISSDDEWTYWHGRLVKYLQSIGFNPWYTASDGSIITIAKVVADVESEAKRLGYQRHYYLYMLMYFLTTNHSTNEEDFRAFNPFQNAV